MNILILGSGGREHALAWKISQSSRCDKLFIAPGNAGTNQCGDNVDISPNDFEAVKEFVLQQRIDMLVVGPEDPLVEGILDFFKQDYKTRTVAVIGPSAAVARLEGSKAFAKEFMLKHGLPTANYLEVAEANLQEGLQHIESAALPVVLKADGLAAGKGVLICQTKEEAARELRNMLKGKFGAASKKVVIEEFLQGIEVSVLSFVAGSHYHILPPAKDYKRIGEGDKGLNTGGMGVVAPVPFADKDFMEKVEERIVRRTVEAMKEEGLEYTGILYCGLMKVGDDPYVIEYNVRFGDPEAEVLLPLLQEDLVEVFENMAAGTLNKVKFKATDKSCATVIMASGGYPENYEKGKKITGLERVEDSIVFHAGTKAENGNVLTNGGRVLAVTSFGADIKEAVGISLKAAGTIEFEGKYFRKDIGEDVLK